MAGRTRLLASILVILAGVVPGAALAAPPALTQVVPTSYGYDLAGTGFGTSKTGVQVFEGSAQVAAGLIDSVAPALIKVRSKPTGTVQHKVVVGSQTAGPLTFTHAAAASAPPRLDTVEVTGQGYTLRGAKFGTDRSKVEVFEGSTKISADRIGSVTDSQIAIGTKPSGRVDHKVKVGGIETAVVGFDHGGPRLTSVEKINTGYKLLGSNFGTDKTKVVLFEGATPLGADKIVSVKDYVIETSSRPSGSVAHKVKVAGQESAAVSFTHTGGAASAPRTLSLASLQATGYRADTTAARSLTLGTLAATGYRADAPAARSLTLGTLSAEGYRE